jgi:hypothetical protein
MFAALGLLTAAFVLPSQAAELPKPNAGTTPAIKVSVPADSFKFGQPRNMSAPPTKTAQVMGSVCRNGAFYCVGIGYGPVGYTCCGCGGCGWWSTW